MYGGGDYAEYYDYLADGTKVRHEYQDGQERFYAGSLVYDQGVFESAPFGGGRIVSTYDDSEAHYFLTGSPQMPRMHRMNRPSAARKERRADRLPIATERSSGIRLQTKSSLRAAKSCRPRILRRINNAICDKAVASFEKST